MVFLSLAMREARAACRQRRFYLLRYAFAVPFLVVLVLNLTAPTGQSAFVWMSGIAFAGCVVAGLLQSYDALSKEKREGTLGLLLLTDLKPESVLLGKWVSASATLIVALLTIVPMLAVPILKGGVSGDMFLRSALNLLNTLFLSLSWGFFVSAIARKHAIAGMMAFGLGLFFCVLLPASVMGLSSIQNQWLLLTIAAASPSLTQFVMLSSHPEAIAFFWQSLVLNNALAWAFVLAAVRLFPRRCHDAARASATGAQSEWHAWRFGSAQGRLELRRRLLLKNPLVWFVNRDRMATISATFACGSVLLIGHALSVPQWGIVFANIILLFWMSAKASYSVSDDQKNGALELLLSTRLTVGEIIHGRVRALLRHFAVPVALILVWEFVVFNPLYSRDFFLCIAGWLIAAWLAVAWVGPWFALRARQPATAVWMTVGAVLVSPFLGWILSAGPDFLDNPFNADIQPLSLKSSAIIGIVHALLLIRWVKKMLLKNFRDAAADPYVKKRYESVFTTDFPPSERTRVTWDVREMPDHSSPS